MAKQPDPEPIPLSEDDQLLANAIPIEEVEKEEGSEKTEAAKPAESASIELDETEELSGREIRSFDTRRRHQEKWQRKPNTTGRGAIHVRTFVSKLRLDAIEHMDEQINQWLDQNPEYEVKMVCSTIGILTGKLREEALFMSVWV